MAQEKEQEILAEKKVHVAYEADDDKNIYIDVGQSLRDEIYFKSSNGVKKWAEDVGLGYYFPVEVTIKVKKPVCLIDATLKTIQEELDDVNDEI